MENSLEKKLKALEKIQQKKADIIQKLEEQENAMQHSILKTKEKTLKKIYDKTMEFMKKNPQYEIEDFPCLVYDVTLSEFGKEKKSNKKMSFPVDDFYFFSQKGFVLLLKKNSVFSENPEMELLPNGDFIIKFLNKTPKIVYLFDKTKMSVVDKKGNLLLDKDGNKIAYSVDAINGQIRVNGESVYEMDGKTLAFLK